MSDDGPAADLAALALRPRGGRAARVPAERLRGLGEAWRTAELALVAEIARAPRRGVALARRFEALAARCGEEEARGRAARLLGSALAHAGRWRESLGAARRAERLLVGGARDGARLGRALALLRLGRTREATALCRLVRADAERRGEEVLAAAACLNEAGAHHEGGDPARAIPLYRKAGSEFARLGRPAHAARAAEAEANARILVDDFAGARALLGQASTAFTAAGLARQAANAQYNLGEFLVATDRLGDAEAALLAAESALRAAGDDATAALARVARGAALLHARLLPEARLVLEDGERALDDRAPPVERARARLLVARARLACGDPAAARRTLARPLPLRSAETLAARDEFLGRALAAEGRPRAATTKLLAAAARLGRHRRSARSRILAAAAVCAVEAGDVPRGARLAAGADRIASSLPVPSLRFGAAAAAFLVEAARGRRADADRALRGAFVALEDVRAGLGGDAMRAALLTGSERWFARAARHVLDGPGGARAALGLVERWRARALLDLLAARETPDPGDDEERRSLRERLAVLERRLAGEVLPGLLRSAPSPATPLLREVGRAERRLLALTSSVVPAATGANADLSRALRRLPQGTLVVVPVASGSADDTRDGGTCLVADRRGVRAVPGFGSDDDVAGRVEELLFRTGKLALGAEHVERNRRRLAAEMDSVLAALAAATIAPLRDDLLRARRLVIVPSGPWHRVPFAALPFEGGRLCDRLAVAFAPSVAALAPKVPDATAPPLVLSCADERAPLLAEEARRVAATLPAARLLDGDAATSGALAGGPPPSCVHLAAHGRFRADAPALSGVRLADGWLRACELRGLPLAGSLVVLSGCDTGVARAEAGGEVHGLVRGVLAAGAAETVLALWKVEDASAAERMAEFHRERCAGRTAEEALRLVQSRAAASGLPPWAWAGFALWTRRLRPPRSRIIPALGGTTLATARRRG